eukprot:7385122-Prymnesium_polylepis.1
MPCTLPSCSSSSGRGEVHTVCIAGPWRTYGTGRKQARGRRWVAHALVSRVFTSVTVIPCSAKQCGLRHPIEH